MSVIKYFIKKFSQYQCKEQRGKKGFFIELKQTENYQAVNDTYHFFLSSFGQLLALAFLLCTFATPFAFFFFLPREVANCARGCGKTRNAETRNNKSGTVKRGTTSPVWLNVDYLHLNFNIFQCKSNRIYIFTQQKDF